MRYRHSPVRSRNRCERPSQSGGGHGFSSTEEKVPSLAAAADPSGGKEPIMSSSSYQGLLASICATSVLALAAASSPTAAQIVSLPSYNVDINQTSVSALSAGGYHATA